MGGPERADRTWADYRKEVFGEAYMVWHDGPDFTEIARRFAEDPAYVLAMVQKGILENDSVAGQTGRHLEPTEEQKSLIVAMLEAALPSTYGATRTEVATSLHALGGSPDLAAEVTAVLGAEHEHWGVRLDAARRLESFPPTPELVEAAAAGVRADDYLVRYHSANTLLHWAGRTGVVSDDDALFALILDSAAEAGWAEAAERLAAAVET